MKPTLVILAAGMASRYGSQKQTQSFGPSGETIMDYSIYDAIKAGFEKVVFIIREDFAENFKAIFEPKLAGKIQTDYVYQHLNAFVGDKEIPADRTKPWGTAHWPRRLFGCGNRVQRRSGSGRPHGPARCSFGTWNTPGIKFDERGLMRIRRQ